MSQKKLKKAVKHVSMGSYPFAGHHQTELGKTIRNSLGASGSPATMPASDPGSVQGEELRLVLAWADAFDAAAAAGVGYHANAGGHAHKPKHKAHKPKHEAHEPKKAKHDH
tara:strand:- start:26814 stop:27146 length:333 start_codon:yes stop_codon:yes gene_type:complete